MNKKSRCLGFSLIEVLLVIGIISILAGIVIVAINPGRQLATSRNGERRSDIEQINDALLQYFLDNLRYPTSTPTVLTEICDTGDDSYPSDVECGSLVDLSILVPTYLPAIPVDPLGSTLSFIPKAYATTNGTGYLVKKDAVTNQISVSAAQAELDEVIAIGTVASSSPVVLAPVYLSSLSGNFQDSETLTANISDYLSTTIYQYNWYKDASLFATSLIRDSRLVLYLPMDNNLTDYSSTYNATARGSAALTANGKIRGGYSLTGGDSCITLPWDWTGFGSELNTLIGHGYGFYGPNGVDNTTGYTISLWIKPSSTILSSATDLRYIYWGGNGMHIGISENYGRTPSGADLTLLQNQVFGPLTHAVAPSITWSADTWYHIVATWNLSTLKLFVNGSQVASQARTEAPRDWWPEPWLVPSYPGATILSIGGSANWQTGACSSADHFEGTVDEFMVYNEALSSSEISDLYYGQLYGGSEMGGAQTTVGESWSVGVSSNSAGGDNWSAEVESAAETITAD